MPETTVANTLRRPRAPRKTAVAAATPPDTATESDNGIDASYLETLLGYNARRAALAVIGVFLHRMAPFGLRPVDFSVLTLIAQNPGITSRQICAALAIQPPNLVGLVGSLQQRGLIERRPHPQDGRAVGLHLTAAGQALHQAACATASAAEAEAASALTPREQATLVRLLRKLYRDA